MKRYNPKEIEPKWQQNWRDEQTFAVTETSDKPKKYIIDMFPYPSGAAMHVGHMRNYTISDVISQFHRQKGYNVMHTMGWDTFGLPAENYAIKTGVPPQASIKQNVANFKQQLGQLGMSYDWNREINTSDPEYYRWTQWIFTQLFKQELAYQKESLQWWCETDKTVLANEQVEAGRCWRCGNEVIKKSMKQWFFKITDYADALLDGIDDLDWPVKIKAMQRNWIGRSQGAAVEFATKDSSSAFKDTLKFTSELTKLVQNGAKNVTFRLESKDLQVGDTVKLITRYDAEKTQAFGYATITAVEVKKLRDTPLDYRGHEPYNSPEERLASYRGYYGDWVSDDSDLYIYEFEKTADIITVFTTRPDTLYGATFVVLAPEHALVHALTTEGQNQVVTDYVAESLKKSEIARQENKDKTGVFTGSYVTNPASGQQIPVWIADYVLAGYGTGAVMAVPAHDERDFAFAEKFNLPITRVVANDAPDGAPNHDEGVLINSGEFDGTPSSEAREKIVQRLEAAGAARSETTYKMRDWLISRQRYWGAPIPIIHCPDHGAVAVPEDQLPVLLPEVEHYQPTDGGSVLASVTDWVNTTCPTCGEPAKRETDTMDGYACSSWYFLRYADPKNSQQAWSPDKVNYWMPVDYYCGGDHAVSHLLYSRFWFHFFAGQGWIEKSRREPVGKLVYNGYILAEDGRKMSKSLGNSINPTDIIDQGYGADALRLFEMFIAPYELSTNWNTNGVPGTYRFLQRVWTLNQEFQAATSADQPDAGAHQIQQLTHAVIKRVSDNLERLSFNTAVAALMEYVNGLYKIKAENGYTARSAWQFALSSLTQLLAPFAPHIAEELWHGYSNTTSVHLASWPTYDEQYLVSDTMTIPVQVNGRVRAQLIIGAHEERATVEAAALELDRIKELLAGVMPKRIIYVPNRLVSIVL